MSLEDLALQAQNAVETLLARASASLRERLSEGGRLSAAKIEREQHAAHGLAWLATYVEAIKRAGRLCAADVGGGPLRRDRGAADAHRPRRISRADFRRHRDEPGRDRPPRRFRPDGIRDRPAARGRRRGADRDRRHGRDARAPRRADRRGARGRRRRSRAGRNPRGDAVGNAALSPTPRSCRMRRTGTAPMPISRSKSSRAFPKWACSA